MHRSDEVLLHRLDALRSRERAVCVDILLALVEIDRRKLHVSLGYASLFAFATRHLRYSESAAGRRVQAARCARDHPEVIALLRRGVANLSTISLVSRVLTAANKKALLASIAGKSQREVEAIVAKLAPPRPVRDRIRPVNVARAEPRSGATGIAVAGSMRGSLGLEAPAARAVETEQDSRSGSREPLRTDLDRQTGTTLQRERSVEERQVPRGCTATDVVDASAIDSRGVGRCSNAAETHFKIQFAAGSAFMRKFEEARALLSGRDPRGASFESVLEAGLDAFLDRNSPTRRNRRREARKARKAREAQRSTGRSRANPTRRAVERIDPSLPQRESNSRSSWTAQRRAIPAAVRDAVFERDDGCCTFIGGDGRRCGSKHDLEVDHCQPVARGGTNTLGNLRLLCAVHNRFEAERVFGATWMRRFEHI